MIESASTPCVDFCFRSFLGTGPDDETPRLLPGTATSTPTISPSPSSHELSLLAIEDKARLKEDLDCSQAAEMLLVVLWKVRIKSEFVKKINLPLFHLQEMISYSICIPFSCRGVEERCCEYTHLQFWNVVHISNICSIFPW